MTGARNSRRRSGSRQWDGGTGGAVEANAPDSKSAAVMVTVVGEFERDRGSTTTLVVLHISTRRRARSGVAARRSIRHAVDDVQIGVLVGRDMEVVDREAAIMRTTGERRGRVTGTDTSAATNGASNGAPDRAPNGATKGATECRTAASRGGASTLGCSTFDAFFL